MFRSLSRLLGFLLLAAGFVGIVFDGARSIANSRLLLTSVAEFAGALLKERYTVFQAGAEANHATLWHLVGAPFAGAPVALVAAALGVILLWLGQPARDPLSIYARR